MSTGTIVIKLAKVEVRGVTLRILIISPCVLPKPIFIIVSPLLHFGTSFSRKKPYIYTHTHTNARTHVYICVCVCVCVVVVVKHMHTVWLTFVIYSCYGCYFL